MIDQTLSPTSQPLTRRVDTSRRALSMPSHGATATRQRRGTNAQLIRLQQSIQVEPQNMSKTPASLDVLGALGIAHVHRLPKQGRLHLKSTRLTAENSKHPWDGWTLRTIREQEARSNLKFIKTLELVELPTAAETTATRPETNAIIHDPSHKEM